MSTSLIVEIILGALTASMASFAFISATRANRAQAAASKTAVDAGAYERAKNIYEGAIDSLQEQIMQLGSQIGDLRTEVTRLRLQAIDLSTEITNLRTTNQELRQEVAALRRAAGGDQ